MANRASRRAWIRAVRKSDLPRETKHVAELIAKLANPNGTINDPWLVRLLNEIDAEAVHRDK